MPRERPGDRGSDNGGDASLWGGAALVALLTVAWVVASFTTQVFGMVGVSATWWLLCRLQGKRFDDLLLPAHRCDLLIPMALTSVAGAASAVVGRQLQLEHFSDAPLAAQEVRSAAKDH